jgi:NAD(P)-dependent dehydrogenase (short-subunit alcohol dehydrogenase family)
MTTETPARPPGELLLIGASRGLGLAMAAEFVTRGWGVVGTVRGTARTGLHDLADAQPDHLAIEQLDITEPDQIAALRHRLAGRRFDVLFVNAGVAGRNPAETMADVSTDDFVRVMVANALSPIRVIEALQGLVATDGLIGVMSSGQGSVARNEGGRSDVYRASKAALNQAMRSYAARHAAEPRPLLLMAPGWIRTDLGGPNAPVGVEESIPLVVDCLLAKRGRPGLEYLDREGRTVPW